MQLEKSPHNNEDPAQSKINKYNYKKLAPSDYTKFDEIDTEAWGGVLFLKAIQVGCEAPKSELKLIKHQSR